MGVISKIFGVILLFLGIGFISGAGCTSYGSEGEGGFCSGDIVFNPNPDPITWIIPIAMIVLGIYLIARQSQQPVPVRRY